jgi:hypothetical protein
LVAVTKMVPVERIEEAISCGIRVFGENRVQDFLAKYELIDSRETGTQPGDRQAVEKQAGGQAAGGEQASAGQSDGSQAGGGQAAGSQACSTEDSSGRVEWHLIGHLQQNKAKYLVGKIAMIHSLDSLRLAEHLDRLSAAQGRPWRVLVQVNVSGEATKFGLPPGEVPDFLDAVRRLQGLEVCGLMTIAPYVENPEEVRPVFRGLRLLQEEMVRNRPWLNLRHLSMGMSNDYEVAVEEGATLVRIGSALFGY